MIAHDMKTMMVTRASGGLGRAVAVEFARRGRRIGLLARGAEGLEGARQDVETSGGEALVFHADVTDAEAVEAAADEAVKKWGGLDVWVNCAMASVISPVREMTAAEYRRVTEVTYLGYVLDAGRVRTGLAIAGAASLGVALWLLASARDRSASSARERRLPARVTQSSPQ